MAPHPLTGAHSSIFLFFFFFSISSVVVRSGYADSMCLTVPSAVFIPAVKTTMKYVQEAVSVVSKFVNQFEYDHRLYTAINDCLDLLDYTADELDLTLLAVERRNENHEGRFRVTDFSNYGLLELSRSYHLVSLTIAGKVNSSTGNRGADLKAWLSAALGNQDTCMEGFQGTNSVVESTIAPSLGTLTSLVNNVLSMVHENPSPKRKRRSGEFPSWMTIKDRRLLSASVVSPNVVVALDGSGNFTTVMDAILAAPNNSTTRYVIYVKTGVYKENVEIKKKKWNLMMIGDGMDSTIISGNRSFIDGWTTFRSATFAVSGRGFIARDITFENTAGPDKHQAVALRSDSDLSAYYRCGVRGYQDTLYAHSLRQFYRECQITGTVDFMFGNSASVFQNCEILVRKGLPNQKNTITAQGRKDPNQATGFSIQFSNISSHVDFLSSINSTSTYLGRPWKLHSTTVFMQSYISDVVDLRGWLEWNETFAFDTLYYGEYMNYGPGAGVGNRVTWPGYHVLNTTEANTFTVAQLIDGNLWLPPTGIKYTAGLVN